MGVRGPVPNREDDLARPRERKGSDVQSVTKGEALPVKIPNADRDWHPIARKLWDSVKTSGQTAFYQQSDWAILFSLCDDLSHFKSSSKRSSQMAQVIYSALGNLLVTEGDRRRLRIELSEPEEEQEPAAVIAIQDYQRQLGIAK